MPHTPTQDASMSALTQDPELLCDICGEGGDSEGDFAYRVSERWPEVQCTPQAFRFCLEECWDEWAAGDDEAPIHHRKVTKAPRPYRLYKPPVSWDLLQSSSEGGVVRRIFSTGDGYMLAVENPNEARAFMQRLHLDSRQCPDVPQGVDASMLAAVLLDLLRDHPAGLDMLGVAVALGKEPHHVG